MWHGSAGSDARYCVEKYRELSAEDRQAICTFVDAI
jgi:hypothetical protein